MATHPDTIVELPMVGKLLSNRDAGVDGEHPVVRTHPVSGRKALWVSTFTEWLIGIDDPEENQARRRQLLDHTGQDRFPYTNMGEPHEVLFWDRPSVNHARDSGDGRHLREMRRARAGGSVRFSAR